MCYAIKQQAGCLGCIRKTPAAKEAVVQKREQELQIQYDKEELLKKSILYKPLKDFFYEAWLSVRVLNCIARCAEFHNVKDMISLLEINPTKNDWLKIRNMGRDSVDELAEYLKTEHGIII